ncbi:MAG: helix-turn-helix domain-containing protein [Pseudobdellovibrionaceae bacterium]
MSFTTIFMVTDNADSVEKAKAFWETHGIQVKVFSTQQWNQGMESHSFRSQLNIGVPHLAGGTGQPDGAKVLNFTPNSFSPPPGGLTVGGAVTPISSKVSTMDEIESKAIETAIHQFKGNLTEAARALGIGRATLYRKVKQYQIDPSMARKKKAA